jgi:hypothetical protein
VQQVAVHGELMEVADGVAAGELVAVKGAGFLKDGDTVRLADETAAPGNSESVRQAQAAP